MREEVRFRSEEIQRGQSELAGTGSKPQVLQLVGGATDLAEMRALVKIGFAQQVHLTMELNGARREQDKACTAQAEAQCAILARLSPHTPGRHLYPILRRTHRGVTIVCVGACCADCGLRFCFVFDCACRPRRSR